jgi:hypothetical protein
MSSVPYDIVMSSNAMTLSDKTWSSFLSTPLSGNTRWSFLITSPRLNKRQVYGTSAPVSTDELMAMCPLNNVLNAGVAAGCIAGIYNKYCYDPSNAALLALCHDAYNRVFAASFFKPIGDVCPAWRKGPRSSACTMAVSTFSYNYFVGKDSATGKDVYLRLTSAHASQLVQNVLAQPKYAPCVAPYPYCNWR